MHTWRTLALTSRCAATVLTSTFNLSPNSANHLVTSSCDKCPPSITSSAVSAASIAPTFSARSRKVAMSTANSLSPSIPVIWTSFARAARLAITCGNSLTHTESLASSFNGFELSLLAARVCASASTFAFDAILSPKAVATTVPTFESELLVLPSPPVTWSHSSSNLRTSDKAPLTLRSLLANAPTAEAFVASGASCCCAAACRR
mmetsp:Transcript_24368/g.72893  ORF Transcript_24368/g.72893 Transcript_24368/m.72893 type:complete len:205 (+) Transcript_24368:827-1441(+)